MDEPVINQSPVKKKGMDRKLKQAGLVVKKRGDIDKGKLLDSLAAVMTVIPEENQNDLEIVEGSDSFVIELSHSTAIILREEIENVLGLHVVPLVDARDGLTEIEENSERMTEPAEDISEEESEKEKPSEKTAKEREPSKPVESF